MHGTGRVDRKLREAAWSVRTKTLAALERSNARYSLVGKGPFFDPELFPWLAAIEANWTAIRDEFASLLPRVDHLPDIQALQQATFSPRKADSNIWKTFIFYDYGRKNSKSCARCPQTTEIIEAIPNMVTALFSILGPRTHIPNHRGPYNGLLRYHLGLKVPRPGSCRIRVGDVFAAWQEGKSIVFDDSFPHEVWNDTDEYRAILFVDVVRPVRFPFSIANRLAINMMGGWQFARNVRNNYGAWEQQAL